MTVGWLLTMIEALLEAPEIAAFLDSGQTPSEREIDDQPPLRQMESRIRPFSQAYVIVWHTPSCAASPSGWFWPSGVVPRPRRSARACPRAPRVKAPAQPSRALPHRVSVPARRRRNPAARSART